ncbi:hypothetical protein DFH07DRAFT_780310 [Mycena maculata]|uniref:Uncharacterized protein n=1 Tax=Mycena maculata TaxID=230809 RepID=A0AAD7I3W1_9AGAR|nr:hypothetical protein DFH07DRAFT_780310 [Mycena maculata]
MSMALVRSATILFALPREILHRHCASMALVYDGLVAGTVPGGKPVLAIETAKGAGDTDAEERAILDWMCAVTAANHALYGGCPPLLADIDTGGVSPSLPVPKLSLAGAVGWWKDYVNEIGERFETQLNLYRRQGMVGTEEAKKWVDGAYEERIVVASQLIDVNAFCITLGSAIPAAALKRPMTFRTSVVIGALDLVLEEAVACRGQVWEILKMAVEHWVFLVGDLARRMSGVGCVCNVAGTDRPFLRELKRRGH